MRTQTWIGVTTMALLLISGTAHATEPSLTGTILDALSGQPLPGVTVLLVDTGHRTLTDAEGHFTLDVSAALDRSLILEAEGYWPARFLDQRPERERSFRLLPKEVDQEALAACHSDLGRCFGVPTHRTEAAAVPSTPQRLPGALVLPNALTTPPELPATVKVARRFASSCAGNPIVQIDEIPFESYVAGVVPAEIGVFKSVPGGPESARASFQTFSVLARTYALWWYLQSGGASAQYHLDDTACNQRYDDYRDAWITSVVATTEGQVMVRASDPTVIDKYEYAASCGRNGTRPEYQTELVPDQPGVVGCTNGGWCGHDNCAAHEDNPSLPAGNRCLVRGTCQWGSLEWSFVGQDYGWILGHYEPNLTLATLGANPTANLVGFVRELDVFTGPDISDATVSLGSGETSTTDITGFYRIVGLPFGSYSITATATGYQSGSREKTLDAAGDFWGSIALLPEGYDGGSGSDGGSTTDDGGGGGGGGDPSTGCGCTAAQASPDGTALLGALLFGLLGLFRRR